VWLQIFSNGKEGHSHFHSPNSYDTSYVPWFPLNDAVRFLMLTLVGSEEYCRAFWTLPMKLDVIFTPCSPNLTDCTNPLGDPSRGLLGKCFCDSYYCNC